jgi:flagellar biosynthesis protein FliR
MSFTSADWPHFLLVLARVSGTVAAAPVFGSRMLPVALRAAIALALAVCFFPVLPRGTAPAGAALAGAAVQETAIGLAIGFIASSALWAVQMGGAILDQELGLSIATALDPASGESVSLVAQFKLALAGAAYLLVDGHHLLLAGLADSYAIVPPGGASVEPGGGVAFVVAAGSSLFIAALKVAAPALVAVLAATVAGAFLARALPEAGGFVGPVPLRLAAGLAALTLGVGAAVAGFASAVRGGDDATRAALLWLGGRS